MTKLSRILQLKFKILNKIIKSSQIRKKNQHFRMNKNSNLNNFMKNIGQNGQESL